MPVIRRQGPSATEKACGFGCRHLIDSLIYPDLNRMCKRRFVWKAALDALEQRQMMSAVKLSHDFLVVEGDAHQTNNVSIGTDGSSAWAVVNGKRSKSFDVSRIRQIRITAGDHDD